MFDLYYLVDQQGPLDGAKTYKSSFASLQAAINKATFDGIVHFSVEVDEFQGAQNCISYVI